MLQPPVPYPSRTEKTFIKEPRYEDLQYLQQLIASQLRHFMHSIVQEGPCMPVLLMHCKKSPRDLPECLGQHTFLCKACKDISRQHSSPARRPRFSTMSMDLYIACRLV